MAQKKITDLQLKASVLGTESFPLDDTIQSYRVTGSQIFDYMRSRLKDPFVELSNLTIVPSVGSSALTIAVKTKAGTDATSTDLIRAGFRSATLTSGSFNMRTITGALSMVVSSGSTLGQISTKPHRIYVYLIDNAGTVELAVSLRKFGENALVSTTAEGGAGAADSAIVMYSTTARTDVPCRLIGYIDNTQTTAGTWASAGTQVQLADVPFYKPPTVQTFTSGSGTYYVPLGCTRILFKCVGPGGGGSGSSTGAGANGSAGSGATTFGPSSGGAGGGGITNSQGGAGGSATLGTGVIGFAVPGGAGGPGGGAISTVSSLGGNGGNTIFGGGGGGGGGTAGGSYPGSAGATNSGGGGGGAGLYGASTVSGGGGGGGGSVIGMIDMNSSAWAMSFAYSIGSGGAGNTGSGGSTGAAGAAGVVVVEEFYD